MRQDLGRYQILEEIGQGGFAVVYRARDTKLDRLVALKELRPNLLNDRGWITRFKREARTIARLDHPRIVTIFDVVEVDKRLFIAMRLVVGPSLDDLIVSQRRLSWSQTVEIISAVAEALDYAHAQNILHRDLKPANILLDQERGPQLSDFGLAKLASETNSSVTAAGGVVGTPHYLAPEVWEGQGANRQSDLYALGCIVYEMVTGEKLFSGKSAPAVMMAHFRPLMLPQTWPEHTPAGLAKILEIALAKQPGERHATAGELAAALRKLRGDEAVDQQSPRYAGPHSPPDYPTLHIYLLGGFRLTYGDESIKSVKSPRLQSLLAYLVLHRDAPQSRQHLAFLLWPDTSEAQARNNLRNLLHQLRRALPTADKFVQSDAQTVYWSSESPFTLDVEKFEDAASQAEQVKNKADARKALENALKLYQGDLLPSCYDDWIIADRERLRQQFIKILEQLVQLLENQHDYDTAIEYTHNLLGHDPLREATYCRLMHLYALKSDRARALQVYQECAEVLQRELDIEPDRTTQAMYERLKEGGKAPVLAVQPSSTSAAAPRLVGRDQEWGALQQAWHTTVTGNPSFVLLIGEAGIGKTRLAETLLDWATRQGFATSSAYCYTVEGGLAYAPVVAWLQSDFVQRVLPTLDEVWLVELTRLLPELSTRYRNLPLPTPLTEKWQQRRLFEALVQPILAVDQPILLLLDDLQWCDQETLEWLPYLLRFDPQAPLLVVGTLRTEEITTNKTLSSMLLTLRRYARFSEVKLGPLTPKETATLAETLTGQTLDSSQTSRLYRATEGNALFTVEMARAGLLSSMWRLDNEEEVLQLPTQDLSDMAPSLPPRVQAVIETRLAQLSPAARELADLAAVVGREFTFDLLLEAGNGNEAMLVNSLDELEQRHVLRDQGVSSYDFSHGQIRDLVYAALSVTRRRFLHRRIGQALITLHADDLELISGQAAAHFGRAGSLDQACRYYIQAADQATGLHAFHKAEKLYSQAIDLAKKLNLPGQKLIEIYSARGRALEHIGRHADAVQVYGEFQQLAQTRHDHSMEGAAIARLVTCYIEPNTTHDPELAEPLIERGLALARGIGDYDLESRLFWSKLVWANHYGRAQEAQTAGEASIAIARQHALQERLAYVLNDVAINLRLSGQQEQGQNYADEARALFRQMNILPMLADNLGQQAWSDYHGLAFDQALKYAADCTQLSQEIHNDWNLSIAALIRGLICTAQGDWGQALSHLAESIRFGEEAGFVIALTLIPAKLGHLLRDIGQIDQAWTLHWNAQVVSMSQAPFLRHAIAAQLAMDAVAGGQLEEAKQWLRSAHEHKPAGAIPTAWVVLADHALAAVSVADHTGEWTFALETVELAIRKAQQRRLPIYFAELAYQRGRCLAALGRRTEAETDFAKAIATAQAANLRPVLWRAHLALAQYGSRQAHHPDAETHHQLANEIVQSMANSFTDPTQRDSFLATSAVQAIL